jgi:hypothetical protein
MIVNIFDIVLIYNSLIDYNAKAPLARFRFLAVRRLTIASVLSSGVKPWKLAAR